MPPSTSSSLHSENPSMVRSMDIDWAAMGVPWQAWTEENDPNLGQALDEPRVWLESWQVHPSRDGGVLMKAQSDVGPKELESLRDGKSWALEGPYIQMIEASSDFCQMWLYQTFFCQWTAKIQCWETLLFETMSVRWKIALLSSGSEPYLDYQARCRASNKRILDTTVHIYLNFVVSKDTGPWIYFSSPS